MSEELRKILDLGPEEKERTSNQQTLDEIEQDFDYARKNLYDVIGKASDALEDMIDVARKSQNPRAYEVLNQMLKNVGDLNADLIELQKKKQEAEKKVTGGTSTDPQVVNQNLFVGTTADLNKIIEDMRTKKED